MAPLDAQKLAVLHAPTQRARLHHRHQPQQLAAVQAPDERLLVEEDLERALGLHAQLQGRGAQHLGHKP